MLGLTPFDKQLGEIEREIVLRGIFLAIDWADEVQVRQLARDALACRMDPSHPECRPTDRTLLARLELFGLAQLMLTLMRQSAQAGIETHGGPVWKAFGRALWLEAENRQQDDAGKTG
ncbi:MAG: hypothetical protein HZC23_05345 [Rhodocyclales bacterium]|nr:hypothetical protein [Rhodocyclales bacterium]